MRDLYIDYDYIREEGRVGNRVRRLSLVLLRAKKLEKNQLALFIWIALAK